MNKMWKISSVAGLGLLGAVATTPANAVLVVDGSLADWGVTIADHVGPGEGACGAGNNTPGNCIGSSYGGYSVPNSAVTVGDTNDRSNSYSHVGQFAGGQDYDAEMLAAAVQGGKLFVGLASGQRNDNGFGKFSPGDLRIVINGTAKYGIEFGGGAGGGAGGAITEGATGTTYILNGSGNTTATAASHLAGDIISGGTWLTGLSADEVQVTGGAVIGSADYVFTRDSSTTQHSIVELSFDLTDLGILVGDTVEFQWGPSCANDLILTVLIPEQGDIPAPAALGLFLLGLGGLAALRRRKAA